MGVKLATLAVAGLVASTPAGYLQGRQAANGGFVEPTGSSGPQLTAWAALGLKASGASTGRALDYLSAHEGELTETTDVELVALGGERAGPEAGPAARPNPQRAAVERARSGRPSTRRCGGSWRSGRPGCRPLASAVRFVLRKQARSGGWSWYAGGSPDSNDTAAAIQALRAAGVGGVPVRRGLAYLLRLRNRDGGFELTPGRGSDTQSTAWTIQAFAAAHRAAPRGSLAYLRSMRRADGSFRYSRRYATTPVWVTAQVLPALAGRAFPLR